MRNVAPIGKSDAGNPHVRIGEGGGFSENPGCGSLVCNRFSTAVAAVLVSSLASASILVSGGKPVSVVKTECEAAEQVQIAYAAQELTNWVAKITGAALPIDPQDGSLAGTTVVLGTPKTSKLAAAFAEKHAAEFKKLEGKDGFIIADEGNAVYIVAERTKGVLNGVYRFLEKNTDIIWARQFEGMDGCGTVYSKTPDLRNDIALLVDVPVLQYRNWTAGSAAQRAWQARLLNNTAPSWNGEPGPAPRSLYDDDTELYRFFTPGLLYKQGKDHPDVFPLINGQRKITTDPQLCFGNPKSARLFADAVIERLKIAPKNLKRILIALGDNQDCCCCKEFCDKPLKLDDGRVIPQSDPQFRTTQFALFVNKVDEYVRKECPWINPLSIQNYIFTAEPPLVVPVGCDNQFCPYVKNHKRPVYDKAVNPRWAEFAEGFKAIGKPVAHVYEYYLCYRAAQFYHAIGEVAQKDLQYYMPHLKEMYNDAPFYDEIKANDRWMCHQGYNASAIEFWVLSRLMWNPNEDVKALRREYCRRAYREAGEIMAAYYEKLADDYNADSAASLWNDDGAMSAKYYIVDKGLAGWMRETLAKAEATAKDPRSKKLIQLHRGQMEALVSQAEKMPDRVELAVPPSAGAPDTMDIKGEYWQKAAKVGPFTLVKKPAEKRDELVEMRITHDQRNLYALVDLKASPKALEEYAKAKVAGKLYDKAEKVTAFDWGEFEFNIDGGLKNVGNFYFCPFMCDGRKISNIGNSPDESHPALKKWTVKLETSGENIRALITWDLEELGVEITKDPKINAMFIFNYSIVKGNEGISWNGGYWNAPTAFQTLRLDMR